jgi:multiple sugar transport system permease protein
MKNYRLRKTVARGVCYALLWGIMLFMLGPIIWVIITSLQPMSNLMSVPPRMSLSDMSLMYYRELFEDATFSRSLRNTISITCISTFLVLAISALGAYVVARFRFPAKNLLLFSILGMQLGPAVAFLIPLFIMITKFGLIDTQMGVVLTFAAFVVPVGIWLLRGFFEKIPRELEPAARMDGCSRLGAFLRIILPLVKGGLTATAIYVFIGIWGDLLVPLVLTFSKATTLTVFASAFGGVHNVNYGGAAAVAVLSGLPTMVLALVFRRYLVRGLFEGSVKK